MTAEICCRARLLGAPELTSKERHAIEDRLTRSVLNQFLDERHVFDAYTAWEMDKTSLGGKRWSSVAGLAKIIATVGLGISDARFQMEFFCAV